jgi:hypothetical protein
VVSRSFPTEFQIQVPRLQAKRSRSTPKKAKPSIKAAPVSASLGENVRYRNLIPEPTPQYRTCTCVHSAAPAAYTSYYNVYSVICVFTNLMFYNDKLFKNIDIRNA